MLHIFLFALLGHLCFLPYVDAITSPPRVQVHSRYPPDSGKSNFLGEADNFLNSYVSGFHPPQITFEILKDWKKIENVEQSNLSFKPKGFKWD
uniref:Immunoglobulin C1-set domain-containing protein n=1 Tax=Monodelphis domestica TaxID=13616 RepID=A0A5F8GK26_MONDO